MGKTVQKKENRRVKYTRMALRDSLLSLLSEYPINKISVSRVCEEADINRSTFYLYYKDVYDLLDKIQDDLYQELEQAISKSNFLIPGAELLRKTYEVVYANRDLCRIIFSSNGDKNFLQRVGNIQRDFWTAEWKKMSPALDQSLIDYLYAFSSHTNLGMMVEWIKRDFQETPEQLAQMVSKLLLKGILAFLPGVEHGAKF